MSDILALFELCKAEPLNRDRWHVLANAFLDHGKPAMAQALHLLADQGRPGLNDKTSLVYFSRGEPFNEYHGLRKFTSILGLPLQFGGRWIALNHKHSIIPACLWLSKDMTMAIYDECDHHTMEVCSTSANASAP